jgi:hypothetical protein
LLANAGFIPLNIAKEDDFSPAENLTANFENAAYCTAADAPFAGVSSVTDALSPMPNSQRPQLTDRARQCVRPRARQLHLIKDAELTSFPRVGSVF